MEERVEPGTHCLRMRENLRNRAVNVSANELSHMAGIVSRRTRNRLILYFLHLERLSNQSRIAKLLPVTLYPLGL